MMYCCLALCIVVFIPATVLSAQESGVPSSGFEVLSTDAGDPSQESSRGNISAAGSPGKRLTDVLRDGGPLMILILFCSFVLVVFTFERCISLRKGRIISNPFAKKFIEQLEDGSLNRTEAIELCDRDGSAIALVFKAGAQKWGKSSVEVEQAVLDEGERQSNQMRRYLRLINGIATVCPLLGLLGTVFGMIYSFDAMSAVDTNADNAKGLIANGISQALLTTAAGLTVAIPALIAYMFFSSRVDQRVMEIDSLAMQVVRSVSAEGQLANSKTKVTRKLAA